MTDDPRIAALVRARHETDYEAWHKRPCPKWSGPSKADQATMEREAELWLPAFERAGLIPPLDQNGAARAHALEEGAQMLEAEAERGEKMGVTRITMRADARRLRELAAGEAL